ncbi:MAG: CD225/dispanin family protein [Dysgonamonadaceae bacterium]|jgi:hypothetical protein|nr:CD225/dispanin family protein [Dysgonamonadaceae bacterium]
MNQYFYIDSEGKQKGTFSPESLKNEAIKRETLVWTQGMEQWVRADEVPELQFIFSDAPGATYTQAVPPSAGATFTHGNAAVQPMPKTYMMESILATILPFILCGCIFSLLGIVGIVNASKVEQLYRSGAYAEAEEASRQAKLWAKVAMWIGIIGAILTILLIVGIIMFVGFAGIGTALSAA